MTRHYLPSTPYHLRQLSINEALSDETVCFTAAVYCGDQRIGTVANRGTGGCHEYMWEDDDLSREFHEFAQAMPEKDFPEEWGGGSYHAGTDGLVDLLLAEAEAFMSAAKWLTFIDRTTGVEAGFVVLKEGRSKVPVTDHKARNEALASNPDLLFVMPMPEVIR